MVAMTCFQKQALLFVLKWTFVFWLNAVSSFAEFQRFTHPEKGDESLSFLVVGDWGRDGSYNQSEVAFQVQNLSFILFFGKSEIADFFFVDTMPFVDVYFNKPEDHIYDWRGTYPRETYVSNLLKVTTYPWDNT
ncbi:hypothetical protein RHMOL_Rhmol08G0144300 [Rhododendron molle]|uniref:Uncharacterized protein n=1 Tax=Rhododendron molle TaxID=49168 RepID=A0ACC0MNP4_RHOML|nr:hypothetical protein RHMOL_Rhmol08G0144300 [Rhododendron molle]